MKGTLVVPEEFASHFRMHSFEISGLLSWSPAMGWDVRTINEDLSEYDTFLTNFSSTETEYGSVIRQIVPDATIIGCFDYSFELIGDYFSNMERVRQVMSRLDHVISVSKDQRPWIQMFLENAGWKGTVHYVPHPTDISNMLKFRKKREERTEGVACFYHQYESQNLQMLEIMKAVDRKLKRHVPRLLIGLKSRIAVEKGLQFFSSSIPIVSNDYPDVALRGKPIDPEMTCAGGPSCNVPQLRGGHPQIIQPCPPGMAWDSVLPYLGVEPYYDALSRFTAALDPYTIHSIGRFNLDCAGVSVPLIASTYTDSGKLLFPFSTVNPHDPIQTVEMVTKVLLDKKDFQAHIDEVATRNLRHFGFAKSRERMMAILES